MQQNSWEALQEKVRENVDSVEMMCEQRYLLRTDRVLPEQVEVMRSLVSLADGLLGATTQGLLEFYAVLTPQQQGIVDDMRRYMGRGWWRNRGWRSDRHHYRDRGDEDDYRGWRGGHHHHH